MDRIPPILRTIVLTGVLTITGMHGHAKSNELAEALFADQIYMESKLSPDGQHLASLGWYKQKPSLYILNLSTKVYNIVTVNDEEDIGPFFWIDPEHIVYHIDKWELYSMGLNVHSIKSNRSSKILNPWETNLYFAGMVDPKTDVSGKFALQATPGGAADLYLLDVKSDNLTKIADNTGNITNYVVSHDGEPVHAIASKNGESHLLNWNKKGEWADDGASLGAAKPLGLLPGDKFLLTQVANDKGYRGINLFNLEEGAYAGEPRFIDGYDLCKVPIYDNLSGKVIGVRVETEKPSNFWFDSAVRKVEQVIKSRFANYNLDYLGYNAAARMSYFMASSDTMPPVIIQIEDGSTTPTLIYQQLPKTFAMEFRPMEPVSFPSTDATQEIHGYLTMPKGDGPHPTIVLLHGGPHERYSWGFDPAVQYLALNGYAVIQVNYRGSTGYGYGYQLDSFADVALLSVDDAIAAARYLVAKNIADPARIAAMGSGFGGYVAAGAAAKAPELWHAIVCVGAPYDFNELKKQDDRKNVDWLSARYRDHNPELYAELSPINHVEKIQAPVLIMHGKDDKRVDDSQAREMRDALEKANKEVQSVFANWGVHGQPEQDERISFFEEVLSFLGGNL